MSLPNDDKGWMPGKWSYLRESPDWLTRFPRGPVHFDLKLGGEILFRDVPANKLEEFQTLLKKETLKRINKLLDEMKALIAKINSQENVAGDGI